MFQGSGLLPYPIDSRKLFWKGSEYIKEIYCIQNNLSVYRKNEFFYLSYPIKHTVEVNRDDFHRIPQEY